MTTVCVLVNLAGAYLHSYCVPVWIGILDILSGPLKNVTCFTHCLVPLAFHHHLKDHGSF